MVKWPLTITKSCFFVSTVKLRKGQLRLLLDVREKKDKKETIFFNTLFLNVLNYTKDLLKYISVKDISYSVSNRSFFWTQNVKRH